MATAQVYIRRFYTKVEIRRTNPYLVIATAVYLACKMEECPHHIRLLVAEGRTLWPGNYLLVFWSISTDGAFFRLLQQRYFKARGMRVLLDFRDELPNDHPSAIQKFDISSVNFLSYSRGISPCLVNHK